MPRREFVLAKRRDAKEMPFPVNIDAVRKAEENLGCSFPSTFVKEMLARNGGEIGKCDDEDWTLHPFFDPSERERARRTCNDIVRETMTIRELDWFPPDGVAIGFANAVVLLLMPKEAGGRELQDRVFVWHLDRSGVEVAFESCEEMFADRVC